jgi:hypothetical protein
MKSPRSRAVGIREENKAIKPEYVECVRQLLQGGIDIRQWETGETSKPVRPCMDEFGREFVAAARQSPRFGTISRVHAGRTQRDDRNVDAGVIHERNACFLGPAKRRKPSDGSIPVPVSCQKKSGNMW